MTAHELVGKHVLCPCHGQVIEIIAVGDAIRDESTGSQGNWILLSDGSVVRFWRTGPLSVDN